MNGRVAILGCGKIGESLLAGLLSSGTTDIVVTARRPERVAELADRHGVEATLSNADAVSGAGIVVLAVKPQDFEVMLEGIAGLCPGSHASEEHVALAQDVLAHLGPVVRVPEEYMDAVTAVSGSGP